MVVCLGEKVGRDLDHSRIESMGTNKGLKWIPINVLVCKRRILRNNRQVIVSVLGLGTLIWVHEAKR